MGFRGRKFEIAVTRNVDASDLFWPSQQERRSETLGGNRDYVPLGRVAWAEVREHIDAERGVIDEIANADDWEGCYSEWREECESDLCLLGFDLGTNALSAALAASRCLPFYACNGGAFDDGHNDCYPLVAFFCRPWVFPFVMAAAERTQVGLEYNHAGGLTAFGHEVDVLIDMAEALHAARTLINNLRKVLRHPLDKRGSGQGELF